MDGHAMTIRAGGRLSFIVERADDDAVSATFIMQKDTDHIAVTENYGTDGLAFFDIGSPDTDVVGVYEFQINENFADGDPSKYPSMSDCDGDCDLPTLEICKSLPSEEE